MELMLRKLLLLLAFCSTFALLGVFSSIPRQLFSSVNLVAPASRGSLNTLYSGDDAEAPVMTPAEMRRLLALYHADAATLGVGREFLSNPHNFSLLTNQPLMCWRRGTEDDSPSASRVSATTLTHPNSPQQRPLHHPLLLIAVLSLPEAFRRRAAIRATWGAPEELETYGVKLVFILGRARKNATQRIVEEEALVHRDIVQEDFVESFRNLTLKSVAAIKWASLFCPGAKYFLKTDDDMFVNLKQLLLFLGTSRGYRLAAGTCGSGGKVIRNERSKYYVPYEQYQLEKWPTYCSGTGYVLSGDILPELYLTSLRTPYLYMEDVYITGLCLKKIKNVKLYPKYRFLTNFRNLGDEDDDDCEIERLIMIHAVIEAKQRQVWQMLRRCEGG